MSAQEIVTIQAGGFANFIGTHWWNMQESSFCYDPNVSATLDINHDVMFREGVNYKGEVTYTPRLILIDSKDNVRSIRQECPLYRYPDEKDPLWQGPLDVIQQTPITRNPFLEEQTIDDPAVFGDDANQVPSTESYNFDSPTTVWSDFLKTNFHPKSFCVLQEMMSEDKSPLDIYSSGAEAYKIYGTDMIEESIRKMTEDCDFLQGFQVIFDSHNGFSGITSNVLQHLDDEYSRRATLCFPTFQSNKPAPFQDMKDQMHRLYAVLLSFNSLCSYSSLFSPLSFSSDVIKFNEPFQQFPYLHYDGNVQYQTSSILAAAIDTLTSQCRLKSMKFNLSDVTSAMSMYSRKLVSSSVCLPFPLSDEVFVNTMVDSLVPEYYMTPISPFYNPKSERTLHQSAVLRGIPKSKFFKPNKSFCGVEPEEVFGEYLKSYSPSSVSTATVFYEKCKVSPPFPKIFKNDVGRNGFLRSDMGVADEEIEEVPVAASFSSSDSAALFLDNLLGEASKLNFKDYIKNAELSYEKDDFVEVIQNLIGLRDNYQDY